MSSVFSICEKIAIIRPVNPASVKCLIIRLITLYESKINLQYELVIHASIDEKSLLLNTVGVTGKTSDSDYGQ